MSTVLPEELVEIIIDMIRYDIMYPWRARLITCSLVSKSWTRRTRYYLFRKITITSLVEPQFMRLLSKPALCTFPPFPKKVYIDDGSMNRSSSTKVDWLLREVLPALSLFPMLETLYINFGSGFLLIKSEKKWNALLKSLSKLTRLVDLTLVQCQFATYHHLAGLVSSFTALETLTLEECEVFKIGPELRSTIVLPSSLHTFNFFARSGKPSGPFLWLCNYPISLSFLRVMRHKPLRNDSLILAKLLRVTGASLKRVNIGLPDRRRDECCPGIDLHKNTSLADLSIQFSNDILYLGADVTRHVSQIIRSVTSVMIEKIEIDAPVRRAEELDDIEWGLLLGDGKYSKLGKVIRVGVEGSFRSELNDRMTSQLTQLETPVEIWMV